MELPRSSPARLTADATIKLPRIALFLMALVYAVPGLLGRDPWKPDDASSFGVMWSMSSGQFADWLMPNVAGAPVFDAGPLMYWLGAIAIRISHLLSFMGLEDALAARAATLLMVLTATTGVWYATYLLGRQPAAQPLVLAFGGQPASRDYGRTLADGALLILLGTLGLVARAHESSPDIAALAMLCAAAYALARGLDRPVVAAIWMAAALTGLFLTRGPWLASEVALVYLGLVTFHPEWRSNRMAATTIALPAALLLIAIWPVALVLVEGDAGKRYLSAWIQYWLQQAGGTNPDSLWRGVKALAWFALPAWPLALWGLYSWRAVWRAPHVLVPSLLLISMLLNLLLSSITSDWLLLLLLPGIVMLAAFGLPTLKRGAANAIDWFSLLVYSLTAMVLWVSWLTRMTSAPQAWSATLQRQVPGLASEFHIGPLFGALIVTAAWIWLVRWRIVEHPKVLWRSVVLASGGVTLIWVLLMTLLVNEVNYSRTYRAVASQLASAMASSAAGPEACVEGDSLGLAQRASFAYFAGIHFAATDGDGNPLETCSLVLQQDSIRASSHEVDQRVKNLRIIWEGRRASDRDERFRLYYEAPAAHPQKRPSKRP
jgi:4-amino-4-deoxy-L-arabinose transferase-like glycosyltransferase